MGTSKTTTTTTVVEESECADLVTPPSGQEGWDGFEGRCVDDDNKWVADNATVEQLPSGQGVSECMVNCRADDQCQAVHAFWDSPLNTDQGSVVCKYVSS